MKRKRRNDVALRKALAEFPDLRLRWIDRLTDAIDRHPGASSGTDIARAVIELRKQVLIYREGFVAALNLARRSNR